MKKNNLNCINKEMVILPVMFFFVLFSFYSVSALQQDFTDWSYQNPAKLNITGTDFDISNMDYTNNFDTSLNSIYGLCLNPTGTVMFVLDNEAYESYVMQYNLSDAWNVSSAFYVINYSLTQDYNYQGIYCREDGNMIYLVQSYTNSYVMQYNLSDAWDLSTADYVQKVDLMDANNPNGVSFSNDGTKMYVVGYTEQIIRQYSLSDAWNISTLNAGYTISKSAIGLFFNEDGTKLYVTNQTNFLEQYNLSTAWDLSTAVIMQTYNLSNEYSPYTYSGYIKSSENKLYTGGGTSKKIYQYELPFLILERIGNLLTITPSRITYSENQTDVNQSFYVQKQYNNENFTHKFTLNVSSISFPDEYPAFAIWSISENMGSSDTFNLNSDLFLYVYEQFGNYSMELDSLSFTASKFSIDNLNFNQNYYFTIQRIGNNISINIYEDAGRTQEINLSEHSLIEPINYDYSLNIDYDYYIGFMTGLIVVSAGYNGNGEFSVSDFDDGKSQAGTSGNLFDFIFNYGRGQMPSWIRLMLVLSTIVAIAVALKLINPREWDFNPKTN